MTEKFTGKVVENEIVFDDPSARAVFLRQYEGLKIVETIGLPLPEIKEDNQK